MAEWQTDRIAENPSQAPGTGLYLDARLWIEKTNVLVDNETDISGFRESLGATEIANALGKKVSPGSRPLFGFSRPNPAGNEISIANR